MTHKEYADSLRLYAAWVEKHTEIPVQTSGITYTRFDTKEEMALLARALGKSEKKVNDLWFELHAHFGHLHFKAIATRRNVCEVVEVGKRIVPEQVVLATQEQIIAEHEEPVYEWHCPSLLEEESDAS